MDFCDSCGILLPVPSTERPPYCNPCKINSVHADHHSDQRHCDCELCRRHSSIPTSDRSDQISRPPPAHTQKKMKQSKQKSPQRNVQTSIREDLQDTDNDIPFEEDPFTDELSSVPREDLKEDQVAEEIRDAWAKEQAELKRRMIQEDIPEILALVNGRRRKCDGSRYYIGGVDISFIKGNAVDACACLTVVQMPDLQMVYQRMEMIELKQPYIPGFLAFREVPPLLQLYTRLKEAAPQYLPDVIMVDGNGTLHPRGFGLACQLGVLLDVPTLGVAKTLITAQGIVDDENHKKQKRTLSGAGDGLELMSDSGTVLGMCLRVHDKAPNPVYISVGHKITLNSAKWITLECSKYRIPEPVRKADLDSREYLRQGKTEPFEYIK